MAGIFEVIKWTMSRGSDSQNFLGARWVSAILKYAPISKRRQYALKILSLSPHYFLDADDKKYAGLSTQAYLETVCQNCRVSREKIFDQILRPHILSDQIVLDYGCGPGFLSRVLSENAKHIYAADISSGALQCAQILNAASNLEYILADDSGLKAIPDGSVDVIVSIAMIQHISDDILRSVLHNCLKKLSPGGKLIVHVPLTDDVWKTEDDWKSDNSLRGKLKLKYGLHCFGRRADELRAIFKENGFENIEIEQVAEIVADNFDDICSQHLLTAQKSSA